MGWIQCQCGARPHNTTGSWLLFSPEAELEYESASYEVWRCYKCRRLHLFARSRNDRHDLTGSYLPEAPGAASPPVDRPGGGAEDWAVVRVAELRAAGEVARIVFRTDGPDGRDRSVAVMRQDGKIEDPPPAPDKPGGLDADPEPCTSTRPRRRPSRS